MSLRKRYVDRHKVDGGVDLTRSPKAWLATANGSEDRALLHDRLDAVPNLIPVRRGSEVAPGDTKGTLHLVVR